MTIRTLAIDPGAKTCACVYFEEGRIYAAKFASAPDGAGLTEVVVEYMQADSRTRNIDVRHLLACQGSGMLAAGWAAGQGGAHVVTYTPFDWKGTEPKPAQHARLWAILEHDERQVLGGMFTQQAITLAVRKGALCKWSKPGDKLYPPSFVTHNLLDAAALGAFHIGRLAKR